MAWESITPHVLQVEETVAKVVLGPVLYADLDQAITTYNLTTEQETLLSYIRPMIVGFSVYSAFPILNIQVSDLGVQSQRSKEGTSNPTGMWEYNDARLALFKTGDTYREMAYKYLQANRTTFSSWANSSASSFINELLVRSNEVLNTYLGKGENINTFLSLRPFLKLAQEKYIRPITCSGLLNDLILKAALNTSMSTQETQVYQYAQATCAWYALYEALPSLKCILVDGVMVTAMPAENSRTYAPLTQSERTEIRIDALEKAKNYEALLKSYLYENASLIPLYLESQCYLSTERKPGIDTNNGCSSFQIL